MKAFVVLLAMTLSFSQAFAAEGGAAAKVAPPKAESETEDVDSLPVPKIGGGEEESSGSSAGGVESFSSAVNVIRRTDRTEVVFRTGESYYMPSGSKYNEIFEACEESEKSGKAIPVTVNTRSRVIISAGGVARKYGTGKTK